MKMVEMRPFFQYGDKKQIAHLADCSVSLVEKCMYGERENENITLVTREFFKSRLSLELQIAAMTGE